MAERKKVLIVTNALQGGGVEQVSSIHLRLMHEQDTYEVALAVCEGSPGPVSERSYFFSDFRCSAAVKVFGVLGVGINRSAMRSCLLEFMPDIIHLHAYVQFGPAAMAEILAYKSDTGCKVILTHHTFSYLCPNDALFNYRTQTLCEKCFDKNYSHIFRDACYGNFIGSVGKYIQKKQYYRLFARNLIDVHIAPSDFMRHRLHAVYPGLDVMVIQNPALQSVLQAPPVKTPGKIVFFGRLSREKNVFAAVRAVSGLPGVRLTLVGDGPDAEHVQTEIAALNARNVTLLPQFVPHDELLGLIADAEYFILPSVCYESSSPMAAVEALNLGMVPLMSDHGGMRELMDWVGVGYGFDPNNMESIRSAVLSAVCNHADDAARLLGPVSQRLERYTEAAYISRILDVYRDCLQSCNIVEERTPCTPISPQYPS